MYRKKNGETLRFQRYHSSKINKKVVPRYSFYTWVQTMGVFGKGTEYGVVSQCTEVEVSCTVHAKQ